MMGIKSALLVSVVVGVTNTFFHFRTVHWCSSINSLAASGKSASCILFFDLCCASTRLTEILLDEDSW